MGNIEKTLSNFKIKIKNIFNNSDDNQEIKTDGKASLKIYNTKTRTIEIFKTIDPDNENVLMYACGPTVYLRAHIGNLRTYINEDILKRTLLFNNYNVKHVINITDVGHLTSDEDSGDDKMELSARKENKSIWDIAKQYTEAFMEDFTKLKISPPTIWCKATDHIKEQIELVQKLEELGLTYKTKDGIYYDTSKFPKYGALGGQSLEELQGGHRVQLSDEKKNITDFALWKFSPNIVNGPKRQMEWNSPWGVGFPGWHIECSAMAMKYLGEKIDIHCGGVDHIKVHHTNEIAQVEPVTKKEWVNYWFHPEWLIDKNNEKMSKSKGEFLTLSVLEKNGFTPNDYRFYCVSSHYRSKLNFSFESLQGAKSALHNLENRIRALIEAGDKRRAQTTDIERIRENMLNIINRDLNTPELVAYMWEVVKDNNISPNTRLEALRLFDNILSIGLNDAIDGLKNSEDAIPQDILDLAERRQEAKREKNFARADEIRNLLTSKGYIIEDSKDGMKVRKK